jgi:VWFA-related protein
MSSQRRLPRSISIFVYSFAFLLVSTMSLSIRSQDPPASQPPPASPASTPAAASPQNPPAAQPSAQSDQPPKPNTEVSMHDTAPTFKIRVNLVQVHVVIRDSHDKPVENLKKEDFQLFDQGKSQVITNFSVETAVSRRERALAAAKTQSTSDEVDTKSATLPERYIALYFDDIHIEMKDVLSIKQAANKFLASLSPSDRVAITSSSGRVIQEFTADRDAIKNTLEQLRPQPLSAKQFQSCPDMTDYLADDIANKNDDQALLVVAQQLVHCQFADNQNSLPQALNIARSAAMSELSIQDAENESVYRTLRQTLGVLASKPGDRVLVLVSPGFLLTTLYNDESDVIDRANRANIVINTIDARGLYVPDVLGDIANPSIADSTLTAGPMASYRITAQFAQRGVLQDFAASTGGTYFHDRNDLDLGLKLAASAPEVSYVLGFSPQNQKMDGRYHELKVKLVEKNKYTILARKGYFAPKKIENPQEQAKQEIQEAVFSQEEIHDLPLDLQTQYFKTGNEAARLSVVSHVEVKDMHFRKAEGRNLDNITVATAIFDENGNFVTGGEKTMEMRLLDATYERLIRSGLTVKSSFDIKPGKYMVRQVVRDSEGAQMAARNGIVAIPF